MKSYLTQMTSLVMLVSKCKFNDNKNPFGLWMHLQFLGDRKLKTQSGINRLIQIGCNNSSEVFIGMCNFLYFFHYKVQGQIYFLNCRS